MNKYIILAVLFGLCFVGVIAVMIAKKKKGRLSAAKVVIGILGLIISGGCTGIFGYSSVYYHRLPSADEYLESRGAVTVTQSEGLCFFDGAGEDDLLILYPGGKIEYTAYAPLLYRIAESGVDCCVAEMPLNIAFLGINRADRIISEKAYKNCFLAGHSLGGVAASNYCANNPEKLKGLVLLASFPTSQLDPKTSVLSVYGSLDGVLDMKRFEESKANLSSDAKIVCIDGANHAGFGEYGVQDGDGEAVIPSSEQQRQTADLICEFIAANK